MERESNLSYEGEAIMPKRLIALLFMSIMLIHPAVAQNVRAVVVNDNANIRLFPAIGAEVIDTVEAGFVFEVITGRSGDGDWLRVEYFGSEGWVNLTPIVILEGDINALPTADPRSIPFGGLDAPRAGFTSQLGRVSGRATDGLRIRTGPSRAYPTIDNINFNEAFTITGRNAANSWYQVNYDGTLGWVAAAFVELINGNFNEIPIGGIVAEQPIPQEDNLDSYVATLQFMLDRVIIAQGSLAEIRTEWTDAALQGRAFCQGYPARPSDFNIPVPLLAAYFDPLNDLLQTFNDAAFNTRQAIDLFIAVCNQPGTGNPVGQATVIGALDFINTAEQQFASVRQRLEALIPEFQLEPDECLVDYNRRAEVLPVIELDVIYLDEFTGRLNARGYCFDALATQLLDFQTLPIPPSELEIFISLSPLEDPSNFIFVNQGQPGERQGIGPIEIPRSGRYLVLIADLGGEGREPIGEYAFRITNRSFLTFVPFLAYDPETATIFLARNPAQDAVVAPTAVPNEVCPSTAFTCDQLFTCGEAQACLAAGNFSLDDDNDGIPCELLCTQQVIANPTATPTSNLGGGNPANCPSTALTCLQLFTCQEARDCLAAGNTSLDPDGNGIPCETEQLCTGGANAN